MKKFWVVLLALGLVGAFSITASAVTFDTSGSYFIRGFYDSNRALTADKESNTAYGQRLRVKTVLGFTDGLYLTGRFDALERVWGTNQGESNTVYRLRDREYKNHEDQNNISMDQIYVTFKSPLPFATGVFDVGYMPAGTFGTLFQDEEVDRARIKYTQSFGRLTLMGYVQKNNEGSVWREAGVGPDTGDSDAYNLQGIYKWQKAEAGIKLCYTNDQSRDEETAFGGVDYKTQLIYLPVYFKATIDNLYLEGEASYYGGYDRKYDGDVSDLKRRGYSAYLYGKYNIDRAYVGAQTAFVSGDDDPNDDVNHSGYDQNKDWNPCLILFEEWLYLYEGDLGGDKAVRRGATTDDRFNNGWLVQLFGGYNITDKLSVWAALTQAGADKVAGDQSKNYGTEADIALSYQIHPNLNYLIGLGYLWTGKYFDGGGQCDRQTTNNDCVLVNKLELSWGK